MNADGIRQAITDLINGIFGTDMFANVADILTKSPTTYASTWSFITDLYNQIFLPLGYAVMLIFFLTALMNKVSMEQFTLEHFMFMFIRLFIVKIALDNGLQIMTYLMNIGNELVSTVSHNSMNLGTNITNDVIASLNLNPGDGLMATLSLMIQYVLTFVKFLIPWLGIAIIKICLQFLCYSRLFEIMIRTVIAPVALGDIFTEGTNGTGFRFLKSYFAICLQGIIIYVICLIFSVVSYDILPTTGIVDYLGASITILILGIACVSLVFKSLSLSKEVMGVG